MAATGKWQPTRAGLLTHYSPTQGLLLVNGPDKRDDKDGGDQHQGAGRDEAQRDEEDRARVRRRAPHLGRPHEGEERGEEGEEDQDHPAGEVPDLDRRLLDGVGQPSLGRIARPPYAPYGPPELLLPGKPDDPREVVSLARGLADPQELEVVAPVELHGSGVGRGELLEEGVGVEAGRVAAGAPPGGPGGPRR